MVTSQDIPEGSVETGDPISTAIMIAYVLLMVKWLATPSISPLPGYVNLGLIGSAYSSFSWLLIVLIPFTAALMIQWAMSDSAAPESKTGALVLSAVVRVRARRERLHERKAVLINQPEANEA